MCPLPRSQTRSAAAGRLTVSAFFQNVKHFDNGGEGSLVDLKCSAARAEAGIHTLCPTSETEPQTGAIRPMPPLRLGKPGFDISTWKTGPGGFRCRGNSGAKIGTTWNSEYWLRRTFQVPASDQASRLALRIHHDEDAEVFLNGTRVLEVKKYLRDYTVLPLESFPRSMLKDGENLRLCTARTRGGGQYIDVGLLS